MIELEETNFFTCFVNLFFSEKIYMILMTLIIFSARHSLRIAGCYATLQRFGENPDIADRQSQPNLNDVLIAQSFLYQLFLNLCKKPNNRY